MEAITRRTNVNQTYSIDAMFGWFIVCIQIFQTLNMWRITLKEKLCWSWSRWP